MTNFSWAKTIVNAENRKIRRAKTQARAQHPDFKKSHPDEARDANENKFTILTARVKKEFKQKQDERVLRESKLNV